MGDLLDKIEMLLKPESNSAVPFMHEIIERSQEDYASYTVWKLSGIKQRMIEEIRLGYENRDEMGNTETPNMIVTETPAARGFLFYFDPNEYEKIDFQHCFDYLKEKSAEAGYKVYLSDVQTNVREDCVEVKERHYLKPGYDNINGDKWNQLHGNITIEHIMRHGHPDHIKFYCTPFKGHNYVDALSFEELAKKILQ
ncbi:MAG TPA: hypothetical protein VEA37_07530 [Flavobacterium sp.]|nr:hypothetical protein [Flavobacterium sp.]